MGKIAYFLKCHGDQNAKKYILSPQKPYALWNRDSVEMFIILAFKDSMLMFFMKIISLVWLPWQHRFSTDL